jgi:4-amino-4-deoxy-L-arabinose transferase-like glycosyltransferase
MNTDHPDNEDGIFQGEWSPTGGVPTGRGVASSAAALVLVLALVIAAGAGLRFFRLGQKSLWVDEAISCVLASTGHDPVELPPLYFRLLGLTMELAGSEEEWALRLLSALCGIAAIPLIFLLGREAGDRWTGAAAALILALSPYHVQISQEARNYALLSMLALLLFLLQTVARRRQGLVSVLAWAASAPVLAAALYTHHLGVLLIPATLLPLLAGNRPWKRELTAWAAALALGLLIYLPQLPRTVEQVRFHARVGQLVDGQLPASGRGALPGPAARVKPALRKAAGSLYYMGAGYRYTDLSGDGLREAMSGWPDRLLLPAFVLLPLGAALLGLLRLLREGRRGMALLLAGTLLMIVGFGALEGSPPNHLAQAFPCLVVLMAVGVRGGGSRLFPAAALTLLSALYILALAGYFREDTYLMHRENWREAGAFLTREARPGDAVFVHGGRNGYFAARYYYRGPAPVSCYLDEDQLFSPFSKEELEPFHIPDHIRSLTAQHQRVWFLYPDWGSVERKSELAGLNRQLLVQVRNFGEDLYLYQYRSSSR